VALFNSELHSLHQCFYYNDGMSQTPLLLFIAPNLPWRYLVQKCDVPLAIPLDSQVDKYQSA